MNKVQQKRYQSLYQQHLDALHRQGKSANTIELYARAVRRITEHFDRCPDTLSREDLNTYFTHMVHARAWSTVKVERKRTAILLLLRPQQNLGMAGYRQASPGQNPTRPPHRRGNHAADQRHAGSPLSNLFPDRLQHGLAFE